jgi:ligand-binding sensor domain-containing protein
MSRFPLIALLGLALVIFSSGAWGEGVAPQIFTNTQSVQAITHTPGSLWVATMGGVEEYDAATLVRRRVFTTRDGLPDAPIRQWEVSGQVLVAIADGARCPYDNGRFICVASGALPPEVPSVPELFEGSRVTARLTLDGQEVVGTAEKGLWLRGKKNLKLGPGGGLCGNHVMAMAEFSGELWLGTFDEGLCRFDGQSFVTVKVPFRMVNDLAATKDGLYVATTKGLYRTRDGRSFEHVLLRDAGGINDLAFDGKALWATSTASLWRIPIGRGERLRSYWEPAGSHSVQGVDVAGGQVWLATEDRGVLHMVDNTFVPFDRAAGLPSSWVVDVAVNADGSAYAATLRDGLVRVQSDGRIETVSGVPDPWLLHVSRGKSRLWVGTQGGAVGLLGEQLTRLSWLPNPCVHALLETDTALWVATEGGLGRYPLPTGIHPRRRD